MTQKFHIHLNSLPRLADALRIAGYEVDDSVVGYRVLMWRKNSQVWSQAYTGLTSKAKVIRDFIRVFGDEVDALEEVFD